MYVIFDFDGVLVDSEECHYLSHKKALKEYGYNLTKDFYIKNGVAVDNGEFYKKVFKDNHLDKNIISSIKKYKQDVFIEYQFIKGIKEIPYAKDLILYLNMINIPVSICSASDRVYVESTLNHIGLSSLSAYVVAGDDRNIRNKPHPDIYLKMAKKLGASPEKCIAIEDSANGAVASIGAGMTSIVIPNEYTKKQNFPKESIVLNTFKEAGSTIDGLINLEV